MKPEITERGQFMFLVHYDEMFDQCKHILLPPFPPFLGLE